MRKFVVVNVRGNERENTLSDFTTDFFTGYALGCIFLLAKRCRYIDHVARKPGRC